MSARCLAMMASRYGFHLNFIVLVLGVVHKWRHGQEGGKGQGFFDESIQALGLKANGVKIF